MTDHQKALAKGLSIVAEITHVLAKAAMEGRSFEIIREAILGEDDDPKYIGILHHYDTGQRKITITIGDIQRSDK